MRDPFFVTADLFRVDPRFATKIDAESEGGCWTWIGGIQKSGAAHSRRYGRIWNRKPKGHGGAAILIHRWVYMLFWGSIPDGYEVHHTCFKDNPQSSLCCNPNHLVAIEKDEHDLIHARTRNYGRASR